MENKEKRKKKKERQGGGKKLLILKRSMIWPSPYLIQRISNEFNFNEKTSNQEDKVTEDTCNWTLLTLTFVKKVTMS